MSLKDELSKRDAVCLLELINATLSCCSKEEKFIELMTGLKRLVPHEYALCGFGRANSQGALKSYTAVNISYPSEWLEIYIMKKYYRVDPIVREHFTYFNLQYWGDTYKKHKAPRDFLADTEAFGLKTGYTHGLKVPGENRGSFFSIAGESVEAHPRTTAILTYLVPHLHHALNRVLNRNKRNNEPLSSREREILQWVTCGKSTWDISVILDISERTVNFHINNIKDKLNAVNRSHALAIAVEQGMIEVG